MNTEDLHYRTSHKCGLELSVEGEQAGIVPPAFPSGRLVLFAHTDALRTPPTNNKHWKDDPSLLSFLRSL
jgi:hypothetical protein